MAMKRLTNWVRSLFGLDTPDVSDITVTEVPTDKARCRYLLLTYPKDKPVRAVITSAHGIPRMGDEWPREYTRPRPHLVLLLDSVTASVPQEGTVKLLLQYDWFDTREDGKQ